MNYTNHATERLLQRYGLEPSDNLTAALMADYTIDNIDIVGTETREVVLRYVTRDNNLITFLPIKNNDPFFQTLVTLRKDYQDMHKQYEGIRRSVSDKDKTINSLNTELNILKKEVEDKTWEIYENKRQLQDYERQLNQTKHYNKELKKKLEKLKGKVEIIYKEPEIKEEEVITIPKKKIYIHFDLFLFILFVSLCFIK